MLEKINVSLANANSCVLAHHCTIVRVFTVHFNAEQIF